MAEQKTTEVTRRNGIGFFGMLGLIFITLKLCNVIDWSWWYVLLPLYGPVALVLGVAVGAVVVMLVVTVGALVFERVTQNK